MLKSKAQATTKASEKPPKTTAPVSATINRNFKTRKRLAPQQPPQTLPPAPAPAARGNSLKYLRLQEVLKRRVEVMVSRESEHGSLSRGDVFLIVGRDDQGWTISAPDASGEPTGRPCSRVHSMLLRLLEEN